MRFMVFTGMYGEDVDLFGLRGRLKEVHSVPGAECGGWRVCYITIGKLIV